MTLIEVLASLAILSTVLVGLIMAKARHSRQSTEASERIEACHLADQLLQLWWTGPDGVPTNSSGPIEGKPDWQWQTRTSQGPDLVKTPSSAIPTDPHSDEQPGNLNLQITRLEVMSKHGEVLASVELLTREKPIEDNEDSTSPLLSLK